MITLDQLADTIKNKLDSLVFLTPDKAVEIGRKLGDDMDKRIQNGEAVPQSQKMTGYRVDKHGIKRSIAVNPGEQTLLKSSEYAGGFEGEFVDPSKMNVINNTHVKPAWSRILERTRSVINMETLKSIIKEVLFGTR